MGYIRIDKPKKWKLFPSDNCPNCGDAVEVLSEAPEDADTDFQVNVFDGEEVRCAALCGFESCISVSEDGAAYVQEGNISELEDDD